MAVETDRHADDGPFRGYAPPPERPPLGAYAATSTAFNAAFAGALAAAARTGRLPERVDAGDLVLIGIASHKLSRMVAKDRITAFLRAPFTEYQQPGGPGEVEERARGRGLRRTVGELLACPYCLSLWSSAGLHLGVLFAPRVTRVVASTFSALTLADFLHIAYKAAERKGLGES
jgi:Protein of unknown function (DUF1360)